MNSFEIVELHPIGTDLGTKLTYSIKGSARVLNLEKLSLKEACGLVSLCPMTVGYALFEDDRSCDKTGNCRTCTRRFLALEMPEEFI